MEERWFFIEASIFDFRLVFMIVVAVPKYPPNNF